MGWTKQAGAISLEQVMGTSAKIEAAVSLTTGSNKTAAHKVRDLHFGFTS